MQYLRKLHVVPWHCHCRVLPVSLPCLCRVVVATLPRWLRVFVMSLLCFCLVFAMYFVARLLCYVCWLLVCSALGRRLSMPSLCASVFGSCCAMAALSLCACCVLSKQSCPQCISSAPRAAMSVACQRWAGPVRSAPGKPSKPTSATLQSHALNLRRAAWQGIA